MDFGYRAESPIFVILDNQANEKPVQVDTQRENVPDRDTDNRRGKLTCISHQSFQLLPVPWSS